VLGLLGKKKPTKKKENPDFLKGSGLHKNCKRVEFDVVNVRKVPKWDKVMYTIDFEYTDETAAILEGCVAAEAHSWNVNETEGKRLGFFCETGNARNDLPGKTIRLHTCWTKNPSLGDIKVRGLRVEAVKVGKKWITPDEMAEMVLEEEEEE